MLATETGERDARQDFLYAVALCLLAAVALLAVGGVLFAFWAFPGVAISNRNRLELVSARSASPLNAFLLLALVAATFQLDAARASRARPVLIGAFMLGGAFVLLAAFSVIDYLTVHVATVGVGAGTAPSVSIGLGSATVGDRLAAVSVPVAVMIITLVAMVGANRLGNMTRASESLETGDVPPG